MPDAIFSDQRLAVIYDGIDDGIDGDRDDLDHDEAILDEFSARSVR